MAAAVVCPKPVKTPVAVAGPCRGVTVAVRLWTAALVRTRRLSVSRVAAAAYPAPARARCPRTFRTGAVARWTVPFAPLAEAFAHSLQVVVAAISLPALSAVLAARGRALHPSRGLFSPACWLAFLVASGCSDEAPSEVPSTPGSRDAGLALPTARDGGPPAVVGADLGELCGPGGWCWENPSGLQSNSLLALSARSPEDVWVVGESGVALHYDGLRWAARWAPTRETLRGVWATSDAVWAVGDAATVLRFDGERWHSVEVPELRDDASLRGVSGRGDDVWIVGDDLTLLERRGAEFQRVEVPLPDPEVDLFDVWADANEVWVVGEGGGVLHHDGAEWQRAASGTGRDLFAVHGRGSAVYFAGQGGEFRVWNREEERFESPPYGSGDRPARDVRGLFVSPDGRVHLVGADGALLVWDGNLPCAALGDAGAPAEFCPGFGSSRPSGQAVVLNDLWTEGEAALVVGDDGALVRFDGAVRTVESAASRDNLLAGAANDAELWVAGDRLLRRRGDDWQEVLRDSPRALYALQSHGDRLLAAGTGGFVRAYADGFWESLDVSDGAWLRGLWSDGQSAWLVGSGGAAWGLLNGRFWSSLDTPTGADLLDVWSTSSGTTWAVGEGGVILRHDGRRWAIIPSGPEGGVTVDLRGVWGGDDDLWAVGTGAAVLHWDGSRWTSASPADSFSLNAVWGRSPSEVWAVGSDGTILRYDGSSWQAQESGTRSALNAVWGSEGRVWIAGERGTVLYREVD